MAYSRNPDAVEKIRHLLKPLEEGKECTWEASDPDKFAYKVREALYLAATHKERFPRLAQAAKDFTIKSSYAQKKVWAARSPNATQTTILLGEGIPTHGTEVAGRPHSIQGPQTAFSVIQAWKDRQPTNDPLYFPQAKLSAEDMLAVYRWSQKRTPKWLMFQTGDSLTLKPHQRDLEEYAWTPNHTRLAIEKLQNDLRDQQ